jgi:hypothetical protein
MPENMAVDLITRTASANGKELHDRVEFGVLLLQRLDIQSLTSAF